MISKQNIISSDIKAFLFDMDGVLFISMPKNAEEWVNSFFSLGLDFIVTEKYM